MRTYLSYTLSIYPLDCLCILASGAVRNQSVSNQSPAASMLYLHSVALLQGPTTAWHIRLVEVTNMNSKASWSFLCNKWLGTGHSDGATQRDLHPHGHPNCPQPHMIDYQVGSSLPACQAVSDLVLCVTKSSSTCAVLLVLSVVLYLAGCRRLLRVLLC